MAAAQRGARRLFDFRLGILDFGMSNKTLEAIKSKLIIQITKMDKEEDLRQIQKTVDLIKQHPTERQMELLKKLSKPIREKLDLEELIKEQNWKPSSKEEIDNILANFDWQISDEDFIELLKDI